MVTKNGKNERVGIVSIVIIVVLAVVGLYYFLGPRSHKVGNSGVPLEVAPPISNAGE